jgi:hypothetical protein
MFTVWLYLIQRGAGPAVLLGAAGQLEKERYRLSCVGISSRVGERGALGVELAAERGNLSALLD